MNNLNYFLVIVSVVYLITGTIGFLYKKWAIKTYTYLFVIVSITIFMFGIRDTILPEYSAIRQIFTILIPSVGSVIVAHVLLKIVGKEE